MKRLRASIDVYLNWAIFVDFIALAIIIYMVNSFGLLDISLSSREKNIDILSNIISTSISLSGFILASLTIIVAIRSNIKSKQPESAETPIELFFSAGNFHSIVHVFKIAIIELVFCFIASYLIWSFSDYFLTEGIFLINLSLIFLIAVSTIRSLFVLFLIIGLDK
jgi:hypothetical protein